MFIVQRFHCLKVKLFHSIFFCDNITYLLVNFVVYVSVQ